MEVIIGIWKKLYWFLIIFLIIQEILEHGKPILKDSLDKGIKSEGGMTYEIIEKDINALTEEEQMDAVERFVCFFITFCLHIPFLFYSLYADYLTKVVE